LESRGGSVLARPEAVAGREDLRPEQVDYINRKLDDLVDATSRVGRKDWVNLVVGTLTNIIISAAIGSEAGKFLFRTVGNALGWAVGEALKLLP